MRKESLNDRCSVGGRESISTVSCGRRYKTKTPILSEIEVYRKTQREADRQTNTNTTERERVSATYAASSQTSRRDK